MLFFSDIKTSWERNKKLQMTCNVVCTEKSHMKKKTIYDFVRTGQNIIYQDFSSIYKRIDYSKSKRLEMLDLFKKKGNCTIFVAKIKALNSWVETAQPICAFVFLCCENIFFS